MLLSTPLFDRIVGTPDSNPDRKAAVLPAGCRRVPERRAAARLAYGQRAQICRDRGKKAGVWDTVMLQDISTNGIGLLSNDPMPIGDTFVLKITGRDGHVIRIRSKVERCEKGGFGQSAFAIGAVFEQVIAEQPLRINDEPCGAEQWKQDTPSDAPALLAGTAGLVSRAFRAASHWMRKADDFSSAE